MMATKKEHLSLGTGRLNSFSLNLTQNNKCSAGKPAALFFFFLVSCFFLEAVGIGCSVGFSSTG